MNIRMTILGREVLSIELGQPSPPAEDPPPQLAEDGPTAISRHNGSFGFGATGGPGWMRTPVGRP